MFTVFLSPIFSSSSRMEWMNLGIQEVILSDYEYHLLNTYLRVKSYWTMEELNSERYLLPKVSHRNLIRLLKKDTLVKWITGIPVLILCPFFFALLWVLRLIFDLGAFLNSWLRRISLAVIHVNRAATENQDTAVCIKYHNAYYDEL